MLHQKYVAALIISDWNGEKNVKNNRSQKMSQK